VSIRGWTLAALFVMQHSTSELKPLPMVMLKRSHSTDTYRRPLLLLATSMLRVAVDEEAAFVLLLAVSTEVLPCFFENGTVR